MCMVTRDKNFRFVHVSFYIYKYKCIHGFCSLRNAICKLLDWYVHDQIDLVSFIFPLYVSCKLFTLFEHLSQ